MPATTATPETTAASAKVENVTESVLTKSLSIQDPAPMVNSTTNPSTVDEQTTTAIITTINQIVTTIAPTTTAEVDSDPNCRKLTGGDREYPVLTPFLNSRSRTLATIVPTSI